MKLVSKFRKLRLVLRPMRKEIKEVAGDQVVLVHPPVVCEFEGGVFDTTVMLPVLQKRTECCRFHQIRDEVQLNHMVLASPEFGRAFNEFYEKSPKEAIREARAHLAELQAQYNMSDEDLDNLSSEEVNVRQPAEPENDQDEFGDEGTGEIGSDEAENEEKEPAELLGGTDDFRDSPRVVGDIPNPASDIPKRLESKLKPVSFKELREKHKKLFGYYPMGATAEQIIRAINNFKS